MNSKELAIAITELCEANHMRPTEAANALLTLLGGMIGKAAQSEEDLLHGIQVVKDALRGQAVRAWEFNQRERRAREGRA